MASCTEIHVDQNHFEDSSSFDRRWFGFKALDCVNGTIMPRKHLPSNAANYTLIHQIFLRHGLANKLDVDVEKIPYETDITIYNKTKEGKFQKEKSNGYTIKFCHGVTHVSIFSNIFSQKFKI